MNEVLQNFVESLREELKQYGELLALLDLQQDQVVRRMADELLATVAAINTQGEALHVVRRERAQRQRALAQHLTLPAEARVTTLLERLPEVYRPLVLALVEENNHLIARVKQRARQNHILLSRAVEMMSQFINSFCSVSAPTYNQSGTVGQRVPTRALYDSLG